MKYLIIGNGVAGVEAAFSIKKEDISANITIVAESENEFYYRPRIIEYLAGKVEFEKLKAYKKEKYEENGIKIFTGEKITDVDIIKKEVKTDTGKIYGYDKMLLAVGARPFIPDIPGISKKGVFRFRGITDADEIIKSAKESKNAVVLGGGLLGIETANSLCATGINVTVVEYFDRLLPRQLDKEAAEILQNILNKKGINFILNDSAKEIKGTEKTEEIELKSGKKIPADMIVISAGVRPRLELAQKINLEINRGIVVNENMETSEKDIYAAGDVIEYSNICYGLWIPAKEQGIIAGKNMTGKREKYTGTPMETRLKVTDVTLFSAGDFEGKNADSIKIIKDINSYKKFVIKEGKLIGTIVLGDNKTAILAGKIFEGKEDIKVIDDIK